MTTVFPATRAGNHGLLGHEEREVPWGDDTTDAEGIVVEGRIDRAVFKVFRLQGGLERVKQTGQSGAGVSGFTATFTACGLPISAVMRSPSRIGAVPRWPSQRRVEACRRVP